MTWQLGLVLAIILAAGITVIRMPGFKSKSPQAVVLTTRQTPWQVVTADIVRLFKIVLLALVVGLAICVYIYWRW